MNRTIIASLVLLSLLSAAVQSSPLTKWGVKTGYTAATQIWEHDWIDKEECLWRSGFHVGLFAEWYDFQGFSICTGINYEQKGMGYEVLEMVQPPSLPGEIRTYYSLYHYISVSVLGKYSGVLGALEPYLLAGPRVDIFLGYEEDGDHLIWGIEDKFKDAIVGLSIGFGIENTTLISRSLLIQFVYNYDPMWLYEFTNELTGNESRVKNKAYNISIGIGF